MKQSKFQMHEAALNRVRRRLRRMGLVVQDSRMIDAYDFSVSFPIARRSQMRPTRVRVAVRVASPRKTRQTQTYVGKEYRYQYYRWQFNFQHHGELDFTTAYADFFVCLPLPSCDGKPQEPFIIPWREITAKGFSIQGSSRKYRGQYAECRSNWESITAAVYVARRKAA